MITAKQTYCGQYKPYGDFFRVWDIEANEPEEAVLDYCFKELCKRDPILPTKGEWSKAIRSGGEHSGDAGYYFRGYYTLESHEAEKTNYTFTVCEPFAD